MLQKLSNETLPVFKSLPETEFHFGPRGRAFHTDFCPAALSFFTNTGVLDRPPEEVGSGWTSDLTMRHRWHMRGVV